MKEQMPLYQSINYISNIQCLFSRYIREYDIRKANISILYKKGVLNRETFNRLYNSPREVRQREIGLMELRDKNIYNILAEGIVEAKEKLFRQNQISPDEVLAIKNDAVFILDRPLAYTEFDGGIEFINKNTYTSYVRFVGSPSIEFYYGYNKVTDEEIVDIKGLGKQKDLHKEYMSDFITYIVSLMNDGRVEEALPVFNNFFKSFINLELDPGYYREYNSESKFSVKNLQYKCMITPDSSYIPSLNIAYNCKILQQLYEHIMKAYFIQNRIS